MKHKNGGKIGGRHTTLTEQAAKVVKLIEKQPEVKSICLSRLTAGIKNAKPRVMAKELSGGIEVKVRSTNTIQEIMVYSKDIDKTMNFLREEFQ